MVYLIFYLLIYIIDVVGWFILDLNWVRFIYFRVCLVYFRDVYYKFSVGLRSGLEEKLFFREKWVKVGKLNFIIMF